MCSRAQPSNKSEHLDPGRCRRRMWKLCPKAQPLGSKGSFGGLQCLSLPRKLTTMPSPSPPHPLWALGEEEGWQRLGEIHSTQSPGSKSQCRDLTELGDSLPLRVCVWMEKQRPRQTTGLAYIYNTPSSISHSFSHQAFIDLLLTPFCQVLN